MNMFARRLTFGCSLVLLCTTFNESCLQMRRGIGVRVQLPPAQSPLPHPNLHTLAPDPSATRRARSPSAATSLLEKGSSKANTSVTVMSPRYAPDPLSQAAAHF